jgi:hypothetical protein
MYLKRNYRLRKEFCDGSNLLHDINLGTQFPNEHDSTSIVTIDSFEMRLGNTQTATRKSDGMYEVYNSVVLRPVRKIFPGPARKLFQSL